MRTLLGLAALALLLGCLPATRAAEPRYFTPELPPVAAGAASLDGAGGPALRLRRVEAAPHLRERMVWRRGVELGFHELYRWTQSPAGYAEAQLELELYGRRGLRRVTRPNAPVLAVELLAFDDVLAPQHDAVVRLGALLADGEQAALFDRVFEAREPISGDAPEEVARALGVALLSATSQVGEAVTIALGMPSSSEPAPSSGVDP